ncbi:MAG: DeoR/GlpR transcriptional regulator [Planctomycetales bacterium]|nr:DeoR/GlpR transcriptional regulator [Planctomycetales bacterium]
MSNVNVTDQRRVRLLELIRAEGFVSIPDLKSALDVSESTVRRDLDFLESEGEARRTHGGVFFTGQASSMRMFEDRRAEQWDRKRQVAFAASKLIDNHDTLLLDGGSTTYELARQLVGRPLQVVTNSLPLANLFVSGVQADLVMLGGYIHSRTGVALGPYANQMLSSLNVQTAVLSIAGADHRGFYNSNLLLVETERAMMSCADRTIVVTDSSKFGKSSLARLCRLSEVDTVVCDDELDELWQEQLREAGVNLVLASREAPASPTENEVTSNE